MKKVSGSLKLLYSQFRELQSFSQFGSDLDKDTKDRLDKGERIVEVLKQDKNSPVSVEHQVVIIYAVVNDFLKEIPLKNVQDFQDSLFEYVDTTHPDIISSISQTKDLTKDNEESLKGALNDYVKKYLNEIK